MAHGKNQIDSNEFISNNLFCLDKKAKKKSINIHDSGSENRNLKMKHTKKKKEEKNKIPVRIPHNILKHMTSLFTVRLLIKS